MGVWHGKTGRRVTGARVKKFRDKKKYEMGRSPTETIMGEAKRRTIDSKAIHHKKRPVLRVKEVNVTDPKKNQTSRVEIQEVEKNPANLDYQRRKVITRGTIIKTPKGRAKVTSRPGQDGAVNAILI
jgi:small subunit ribosomal protein S8e